MTEHAARRIGIGAGRYPEEGLAVERRSAERITDGVTAAVESAGEVALSRRGIETHEHREVFNVGRYSAGGCAIRSQAGQGRSRDNVRQIFRQLIANAGDMAELFVLKDLIGH